MGQLPAGRNLADLARGLQTEYGLLPDDALEDARQFVERLMQEGLIELAKATSALRLRRPGTWDD